MSKVIVIGVISFFFFQAEDGIRDAQESCGLGDVYKRQRLSNLISRSRTTGTYGKTLQGKDVIHALLKGVYLSLIHI